MADSTFVEAIAAVRETYCDVSHDERIKQLGLDPNEFIACTLALMQDRGWPSPLSEPIFDTLLQGFQIGYHFARIEALRDEVPQ